MSVTNENNNSAKHELNTRIIGTLWHVLSNTIIKRKKIESRRANAEQIICKISNGINQDSNEIELFIVVLYNEGFFLYIK